MRATTRNSLRRDCPRAPQIATLRHTVPYSIIQLVSYHIIQYQTDTSHHTQLVVFFSLCRCGRAPQIATSHQTRQHKRTKAAIQTIISEGHLANCRHVRQTTDTKNFFSVIFNTVLESFLSLFHHITRTYTAYVDESSNTNDCL